MVTQLLTNLVANTTYQFQVSSICLGVSTGYSTAATFTTTNTAVACATPYGLTTTNITNASAVLNWTSMVTADSFMVRYSKNGTTNYVWKQFSGQGGVHSTQITGLLANTAYQWQVRSICTGNHIGLFRFIGVYNRSHSYCRTTRVDSLSYSQIQRMKSILTIQCDQFRKRVHPYYRYDGPGIDKWILIFSQEKIFLN
ncbi:MAG: fibronectin type III domain-containing protein [Bacteroidetes bacterium]|nr:fibronectin type III domain-containing protein [Bacteroidota bacterium]